MSETPRDEIVDEDDVDDVIGIASEIADKKNKQAVELRRAGGVEIDAQLGLEAGHVEEAIDVLHDREEAAEQRSRTRAKIAVIAGASVAAIAMLALILAFVGRSSVRSARAEVARARAQGRNEMDRQANVEKRLAGAELDSDREAELAGAENRVANEKRRYDDAATRYNREAGSFPGSWGATMFGLPKRVPLSNEMGTW